MTGDPLGACGVDTEAYPQTEKRSCSTHGLTTHELVDGEWQCVLCPSQRWSG